MEEEEEEARALLPGGPDEAGRDTRAAPAASGALQALCDPSRLAHRLVVLLLMCFLGFGEPAGLVGWDWKSSNSRLSRSCVELQGPPALFLPHLRDPHSTLLQAIQFPKVRGQGTELSDFCPTHLLSQEVPKASNLPSGAVDMRESLDVRAPSHDTVLEGIEKDVIPSPK